MREREIEFERERWSLIERERGKECIWPDSFWKTLFNVLHHITDPFTLALAGFYTLQSYIIITSYVAMSSPNHFIRMFLLFDI